MEILNSMSMRVIKQSDNCRILSGNSVPTFSICYSVIILLRLYNFWIPVSICISQENGLSYWVLESMNLSKFAILDWAWKRKSLNRTSRSTNTQEQRRKKYYKGVLEGVPHKTGRIGKLWEPGTKGREIFQDWK